MKWYVYELCDPCGARFYVGKGCGRRMYQHLTASHSDAVNSMINKMRKEGIDPVVREIAYFYEEVDALNFEADIISKSVGLLNKAKNPKRPRTVSMLDVFARAGQASIRELSIARKLCTVGADKYPWLADMYNKIAESLSKVEASRYATT